MEKKAENTKQKGKIMGQTGHKQQNGDCKQTQMDEYYKR